jgi:hypothetical protein
MSNLDPGQLQFPEADHSKRTVSPRFIVEELALKYSMIGVDVAGTDPTGLTSNGLTVAVIVLLLVPPAPIATSV